MYIRYFTREKRIQNEKREILQNDRSFFPGTAAGSLLQKGSLTVEAAWAVPLFFLCVAALTCMIRMYGIAAAQYVKLQEYAERTGMAAGTLGESTVDVIDLKIPATFKVELFPGVNRTIWIACRARVYPWTGRSDTAANGNATHSNEVLVLVTETASVYHTDSGCSHLSLSIQQVSASRLSYMRNSSGSRYHACDKCARSGTVNSSVFVTDDGDCYHNSSECSGLTRHVRLVPQSEVGSLHICSRCQFSPVGSNMLHES